MVLGYTCWLLDETERAKLLELMPAVYPVPVAHHVTLDYGVPDTHPLPTATRGLILGEIMDKGVQAFVVEIDGTTTRPDGETYHITWSLDYDRYPENAKTLVRRGFYPLAKPIEITLIPTFIVSDSLNK